MLTDDTILFAIGSTEASTFNEFCRGLEGDCPDTGDKESWRELFQKLKALETAGFIEISKNSKNQIDTLILTPEGADKIRSQMDTRRGLFHTITETD